LAAFARTIESFNKCKVAIDSRVIAYLEKGGVKDEEWATAPAAALGIQINGGDTSNRVEQLMNTAIKIEARHENPLCTCVRMSDYWCRVMAQGVDIVKTCREKKMLLIPYAMTVWEASKKRYIDNSYTVDITGGVHQIVVQFDNESKYRRDVDLLAIPIASCTCQFPALEGLPCHHIVAALYKSKFVSWSDYELLRHLFDEQYFVDEYERAYSAPPLSRPRLCDLKASVTTKPPTVAMKKKAGGTQSKKRHLGAEEQGYGGQTKKRMKQFRSDSKVKEGDISLLPAIDPTFEGIANVIKERASSRAKQENTLQKKIAKPIASLTSLVSALPTDDPGKSTGSQIVSYCVEKVAAYEAAQEQLTAATLDLEAAMRQSYVFSVQARARIADQTKVDSAVVNDAETAKDDDDDVELLVPDESATENAAQAGEDEDDEVTVDTEEDFTDEDPDVFLNAGLDIVMNQCLAPLVPPALDDEFGEIATFQDRVPTDEETPAPQSLNFKASK
jgi:hypothetical protein